MNDNKNVIPINISMCRSAAEAIAEVRDWEPDEVMVVGLKDGQVVIKTSKTDSVVTQLGLLETLKDHILRNWK